MSNGTFVSWLEWVNAVGLGVIAALLTVLVIVFTPLTAPEPVPKVVGAIVALAYLTRRYWGGVLGRT